MFLLELQTTRLQVYYSHSTFHHFSRQASFVLKTIKAFQYLKTRQRHGHRNHRTERNELKKDLYIYTYVTLISYSPPSFISSRLNFSRPSSKYNSVDSVETRRLSRTHSLLPELHLELPSPLDFLFPLLLHLRVAELWKKPLDWTDSCLEISWTALSPPRDQHRSRRRLGDQTRLELELEPVLLFQESQIKGWRLIG